MLKPEQLAKLRTQIEKRRAALELEIRDDAGRSRDEPYTLLAGEAPDAGDMANANLISDLDHAELSRDLEEFRALETAQKRIDSGHYGSCLDCGREIGFERLLAQPSAVRCFECQTTYERTHAHTAEPKL